MLPGRSYTAGYPALRVPALALSQVGYDIAPIEYAGGGEVTWNLALASDWDAIVDSVLPQVTAAITGASMITVLAKSLGTAIAARLGVVIGPADAIWVTPLFADAEVRAGAIATGWRSLSIFGTADPAHDPAGQAEVTAALSGEEIEVEGANHSRLLFW